MPSTVMALLLAVDYKRCAHVTQIDATREVSNMKARPVPLRILQGSWLEE